MKAIYVKVQDKGRQAEGRRKMRNTHAQTTSDVHMQKTERHSEYCSRLGFKLKLHGWIGCCVVQPYLMLAGRCRCRRSTFIGTVAHYRNARGSQLYAYTTEDPSMKR